MNTYKVHFKGSFEVNADSRYIAENFAKKKLKDPNFLEDLVVFAEDLFITEISLEKRQPD